MSFLLCYRPLCPSQRMSILILGHSGPVYPTNTSRIIRDWYQTDTVPSKHMNRLEFLHDISVMFFHHPVEVLYAWQKTLKAP